MGELKLGRQQLKIMQILWEQGEATARKVTETMNADEPIAHSSVQTLLRTLEDKGAVAHRTRGRTFIFYPVAKEERVKRSATRDLVERVFAGNVGNLVSYLLENEKISRSELSEIRRSINRRSVNKRAGDQ